MRRSEPNATKKLSANTLSVRLFACEVACAWFSHDVSLFAVLFQLLSNNQRTLTRQLWMDSQRRELRHESCEEYRRHERLWRAC